MAKDTTAVEKMKKNLERKNLLILCREDRRDVQREIEDKKKK